MQLSLKTLVAAGALALASTSAFAQVVVPEQPGAGPFVSPGTGSGSVLVSIWDEVRGVSIVQHLGLTLNDILPDAGMTTEGTVLNFGTIDQFASVFAGSNAADIQYTVIAGDAQGQVFSGKRIAVSFSGNSYSINNAAVSGAATAIQQYTSTWLNSASGCNGTNACVADDSGDGQYAGRDSWNDRFNGQVPVSAAGSIGSVLHFALAATPNSGAVAGNQAAVTLYQSANGTFGEWLLGTDGTLTYSVSAVPLPAAAWLLLSGLMGMGVVTRRRKDA